MTHLLRTPVKRPLTRKNRGVLHGRPEGRRGKACPNVVKVKWKVKRQESKYSEYPPPLPDFSLLTFHWFKERRTASFLNITKYDHFDSPFLPDMAIGAIE
jgi:hypothetical protein